MKILSLVLLLCFALPSLAITEGGLPSDPRSSCQNLLLSTLHEDVTDVEVMARAAAAEVISLMILEHPMLIALSESYSGVNERSAQDMFHLSMGLIAPVAPVPGLIMPDMTGRSRFLKSQSSDFKAVSKMVYSMRDPKVFAATSESKRKALVEAILNSSLMAWKQLANFGGFSGERSRDIPQIKVTGPLHLSQNGQSTNLKISDLRGPTMTDLARLRELVNYLDPEPVDYDGTLFTIDAQMALSGHQIKVADAEIARGLVARFLMIELPNVLMAREEVYLQAVGKTEHGTGFKAAVKTWTYGSARESLRYKMTELAQGLYNFTGTSLPAPQRLEPISLPAPSLENLLQTAQNNDGMTAMRAGMRALDLLIEDFPKAGPSFAFLANVRNESDLRQNAAHILQELTKIEDVARPDFEKITLISETATSLSERLAVVLTSMDSETTSTRLSPAQEASRKEEVALSQVTFIQSQSLIENRVAHHQRVLTITHQLQALVRQYRYQLLLEQKPSELGQQIVEQIRKLTAKDELP